MRHVRKRRRDVLNAIELRRWAIWKRQPTINLAVTDPAKKQAYKERVEQWLTDMQAVDAEIAAVKRAMETEA